MLKVAVWNLNGGTSKSCTVQNLGAELARAHQRTVLIDLDGQGTLTYALGMEGAAPTVLDWIEGKAHPLTTDVEHLYLVPGDVGMFQMTDGEGLMAPALERLKGFDLCLMDCPPSLGFAAVQAVLSADRVLVPTLCEPASLKGVADAVQFIHEERPGLPIDVVRARYRSRLVLSRDMDIQLAVQSVAAGYGLLETTLPENIAIAEAIAQQVPVCDYDPHCAGTLAYRQLAMEVLQVWGLTTVI
jgi:chromosome partitioning protein